MPCDKCSKPKPTKTKPNKCMCGGNIVDEVSGKELTGLDKARAKAKSDKDIVQAVAVKYSPAFKAHIFDGEDDTGGKHKGLHSMARLAKKDKPGEMRKISTDSGSGAYSAWVKLHGKTAWKASTFFPDTWTEAQVLEAIEAAYKEYRVKKTAALSMTRSAGLTWAASITIHGKTLWIGGLGDGDAMTGLSTAFPAVDDSFTDPNNGTPPT
jgi:hypothetical protein